MNALKTLALVAAAGSSLAACSASGPSTGPRSFPADDDRLEVRVENRAWSDMNVYAVENGMRFRLGTVTSMNSARLHLPMRNGLFTHDVQLIAVPIGNFGSYESQPVQVSRGQSVGFTIQNHLSISSVSVFNN